MKLTAYALPVLLATGLASGAGSRIEVVATVPNLGSIAADIGGDRVSVETIATGLQDPHFVDPKPSFVLKLRSADVLLVNGLDLEIGWVPPLTQGSRNGRVQPGAEGYLDCSVGIPVLEIPRGTVSRAGGDVHPYGNPHYLGDPLNAEIVAARVADAFTRISPGDARTFETRRAAFTRRLHESMFGPELVDLVGGPKLSRLARSGELSTFLDDNVVEGRPLSRKLGGWLARMRPFAGAQVVTYHRDFTYFAGRFGIHVVDFVEPKPGIPPSAKHLVEMKERLRDGGVRIILTRPYVEHRSTDLLAEQVGIPVLTLPLEVGGIPEATDYLALYDAVINRFAGAMSADPRPPGTHP